MVCPKIAIQAEVGRVADPEVSARAQRMRDIALAEAGGGGTAPAATDTARRAPGFGKTMLLGGGGDSPVTSSALTVPVPPRAGDAAAGVDAQRLADASLSTWPGDDGADRIAAERAVAADVAGLDDETCVEATHTVDEHEGARRGSCRGHDGSPRVSGPFDVEVEDVTLVERAREVGLELRAIADVPAVEADVEQAECHGVIDSRNG